MAAARDAHIRKKICLFASKHISALPRGVRGVSAAGPASSAYKLWSFEEASDVLGAVISFLP